MTDEDHASHSRDQKYVVESPIDLDDDEPYQMTHGYYDANDNIIIIYNDGPR